MLQIPETRDLFYPQERQRVGGREGENGWLVGHDLGAEIVVLDRGPVVAVSEISYAFVNSSVRQYVRSLQEIGRLRDHLIDHPDDEDAISACETELRSVDEHAFRAEEYWSLVIEQIRREQF
jgi:SUKH-4 immunity protein